MNTLKEIAGVIRRLKSAVIFTHMRPDGDALGSAMALSRALFMLNIPNEVVNEGAASLRAALAVAAACTGGRMRASAPTE